jgi:phosphoenolpyruvate carboxykinase (ATP)
MDLKFGTPSKHGLENHGLKDFGDVYWTLSAPDLAEHVAARGEGRFTDHGAFVVSTGSHTGRAPNDKFIVREGQSAENIWWGKVNLEFEPEGFDQLHRGVLDQLEGKDLYVQDAAAGAQSAFQIPIRVVTGSAWHSLFARSLFRRLPHAALADHVPEFTILHAPGFRADPTLHGTNSEVFILLSFERGLILIGGTSYAGEIKKSIFTVMNYLLPLQGVLSMHCSANKGQDGDVALFFGLSGTGKTTLSSDTERSLIGDDEHGWSDEGVFNFEGGCYAKTIRLSAEHEPIIWKAARNFGTVLENVVMSDRSRSVDFDDGTLTENTRAGYPMDAVKDHVPEGTGDHPENVFFLTADAFGVMPPISRLSPEQAMYYFLSGYTSKLGGTEKGLGDEPQATFSACFGEPFLPLHPSKYAELLGERISRHGAKVWLVNTGWTGGKYGVGERIHLPYTRAMVSAALGGALDDTPTHREPFFGLEIPDNCPGVPEEVLDPRKTWADPEAYDEQAKGLAARFTENFQRYVDQVTPEVVEAGPAISVR